jgi:hypothetical protein
MGAVQPVGAELMACFGQEPIGAGLNTLLQLMEEGTTIQAGRDR